MVPELGAPVMIDAELDPGDPKEPRGDVGPDARQSLRYQRRYPAVKNLEWLPFI